MATWVSFVKAQDFPAIKNKYKRTSQFLKAVKAEVLGSAVWARRAPVATNLPKGDAGWQVDVAAVTLVRPMREGGALKS